MALPLPSHPLAVETNVADYAIGLAYASHLKNEASALELLGVDAGAWARAGAWPERLADGLSRGDRTLATAFGAAFNETKERLRAASGPPAGEALPGAAGVPELGPSLLAQLSNAAVARPAPVLAVPAAVEFAARAPAAQVRDAGPPPDLPPDTLDAPHTIDSPDTAETTVVSTLEGLSPFAPGAPLPFVPADRAAPAAVAAPAARAAAPSGELPLEKTLPAQKGINPALPFRAPTPHELTLEQYASLCAALDCFPDKVPVILQRYGITEPGELERLHEIWRARFANTAGSRAAWQRQVEEVRGRLRGGT